MRRRALIVGGSLGGLFAAHQLRSIGWDVEVFERTGDDLADRGAGIGTHRALLEIMRRVGLGLGQSGGTAPQSYICLDRAIRLLHEMRMCLPMTAWSSPYRPWKDNLPSDSYHSGKFLESLETDDNAATAIFSDGTRVSADLLIGADGFRSTVRNQILPEVNPAYAGYVAWRALVAQGDIPATAWKAIHKHYVFCVPEGELLVSYPLPTRDGDMNTGPLDS